MSFPVNHRRHYNIIVSLIFHFDTEKKYNCFINMLACFTTGTVERSLTRNHLVGANIRTEIIPKKHLVKSLTDQKQGMLHSRDDIPLHQGLRFLMKSNHGGNNRFDGKRHCSWPKMKS